MLPFRPTSAPAVRSGGEHPTGREPDAPGRRDSGTVGGMEREGRSRPTGSASIDLAEFLVALDRVVDPVFSPAAATLRDRVVGGAARVTRSPRAVPVEELLGIYRGRLGNPRLRGTRVLDFERLVAAFSAAPGTDWYLYSIRTADINGAVFVEKSGSAGASVVFPIRET